MTDIIQDAKRLLDGATPGPWVASDNGYIGSTSGVMIHDGQVLGETAADTELIAAAPEIAQALAEETWECIVQVKCSDQWRFYIGESRLPTDKPGLANGFSKVEHALEFSKMETEYPTRVVRRRVSPPEVIV